MWPIMQDIIEWGVLNAAMLISETSKRCVLNEKVINKYLIIPGQNGGKITYFKGSIIKDNW